MPISIGGDGDFLMGATAIWTAAHYRDSAAADRRQQPLVLQR
jgi:thiamine pyrophosphate-dependent acetolactate synthase large subunit-like protein